MRVVIQVIHVMDLIQKYLILLVVVWRITHLITAEDGPFDIIIRVRKKLDNSFLGKLMDCFYCLSIWVGLAVACYTSSNFKEVIILSLYYSGASILIEKITNKTFH